jgi:predicted kinase
MPILTVLVGLPASGKSYSIPEDFSGFVYSTDTYIDEQAKALNKTYNDVFFDYISKAVTRMDALLDIAIKNGDNVIWDQTNPSRKKRRQILSMFPRNYRKVCVCRLPPRTQPEWDELNRRLNSRPGKVIPPNVLSGMINSFVKPDLDEGFDVVEIFDIYGRKVEASA